ncbi:4'-phosphopantetheinyl transferase family protein [Hugenholtzia roseola]|uniref:4'-phosphopantetheinyl transferase family protein n=1 Tax=Hugenholtzia roseola TaxID=1002 RepID=UPI0004027649|nr:4'-phosphopantetheinyl transferase superfamily protein [Hugenholtzia roseola]
MPIFLHKKFPHYDLVLWKIDENEAQLHSLAQEEEAFATYKNPTIRLEKMAAALLLSHFFPSHKVEKAHTGKPFLKPHTAHISISHSYPWVALAFSRTHALGLDVEAVGLKVETVAPRVLHESELAFCRGNRRIATRFWSAKEALYKCLDAKGATWRKDIRVLLNERGQSLASFIPTNEYLNIDFLTELEPHFVLAIATKKEALG